MAILGSTSLTGCNSIPDFIAAGSLMMFQQTASPTSWTKQTTHNNKALRVVNATAGSGGTTAFTTVFAASRAVTGTVSGSNTGGSVSNHTLTTTQIPSHSHTILTFTANVGNFNTTRAYSRGDTGSSFNSNSAGGSGAHAHGFTNPSWSGSFTGTALNFAVQYVDIIIASKN
jgi:hypothetical protein